MTEAWSSFAERLACREPDALRVFGELSRRLVMIIRQNLDPRLFPRLDAEDILQSVLRSFLRGQTAGQFVLETADDLWGLLVVIAVRKCARKHEQHFAERRDVRREAPAALEPHSGRSLFQVLGREPSPAEAVVLAEATEQLFAGLKARERDVLVRAMAGQSVEQISSALGRTQRTIRRLLLRIRQRLENAARE